MSLEVIDTVAMLAIPHMPGRVFRIRTGCHSGNELGLDVTQVMCQD